MSARKPPTAPLDRTTVEAMIADAVAAERATQMLARAVAEPAPPLGIKTFPTMKRGS